MKTLLLTTRDTNKVSKISAIISGILDIVFVILAFAFFNNQQNSLPTSLRDDFVKESAGLIILVAVAFGAMIIYTAYQFVICRSYVDVYSDRVEGKGIQNVYQVIDFSLSYDKITNITCAGIYVHIHTAGGQYKILTNAETAKKVYEYYNSVRSGL